MRKLIAWFKRLFKKHPDTARLDYLIEHFIDFREQPTPADFRDDIDRMMRHE
jgi:hypothetical protein